MSEHQAISYAVLEYTLVRFHHDQPEHPVFIGLPGQEAWLQAIAKRLNAGELDEDQAIAILSD